MSSTTPYLNNQNSRIGYARVSSKDQNPQTQIDKLEEAQCSIIRVEQRTGAKLDTNSELQTILDFIREGDTLVVTRIDRLARSMRDLQTIMSILSRKNAHLEATDHPINTATAAGKMFVDLLGVFAEFELNIRSERQAEGIANAKKRGVYKGRSKSLDHQQIITRLDRGERPTDIALSMKVSRSSIYRIKNAPKSQIDNIDK